MIDVSAEVLSLTLAGWTAPAIAAQLGVSRSCVDRWRQRLAASYLSDPAFSEPNAGPPRPDAWGGLGDERDPSEDQIRRRCLAIRKTWDEAERRAREGEVPDGLSHRYSEARRGKRVG